MARMAPVRRRPIANAAGNGFYSQAQAEIDPIIAAITAAAQQKARASEAAIKGFTDSYARQLAGADLGAPYTAAQNETAAVDAALRQALSGGGADLASQLAGRLSQLQGSSGESAVQQAGGALASQGAGAGNARLASGSAALNALIGEQANARSYGAKMPGLAKLSGLQGLRQAEGNAQQEIAQGTLSAEQNLPTIENELRSAAQARAALKSENAYRQATLGQAQQRLGIEAFRAQTSAKQGQERINIEAQRAAQTALNENRNYQLALGRLGVSQKSLQLRWLTAQAKLKGGGYTPAETHRMQVTANTIAGDAGKHNASLEQLMHTMAVNDIPPTIAVKAAKLSGYHPGHVGNLMAGLPKIVGIGVGAAGSVTETQGAKTIVGLARQYIGTPYVWGGESPKGFDCSGFAQFLYGKAGIRIPRTTYTQWQTGHSVPKGQLAPGDLVFFRGSDSVGGLPGHVGIYIGGGKMIDAPHTGANVRIESVNTFGGYMGARRYGNG